LERSSKLSWAFQINGRKRACGGLGTKISNIITEKKKRQPDVY
jgi:hypothetical protein